MRWRPSRAARRWTRWSGRTTGCAAGRAARGRAGQGPKGDRGPGKAVGDAGGSRHRERRTGDRRRAEVIDAGHRRAHPVVGVKAACAAVGGPERAIPPPPQEPTATAARADPGASPGAQRRSSARTVLAALHSDGHVDEAPATVYAKLLDQGIYLASTSTMYRILRGQRRGARPATAGDAPADEEARAAGDQTQRGLFVGHHQAGRPRQVDLLLPVRDHRHLQPLRARLVLAEPNEHTWPSGCWPTPSPSTASPATEVDPGVVEVQWRSSASIVR